MLARLPIVPGLYPHAVADLTGDDMRLQAEAYVRGVQNRITDLVAIRELYKARIRLMLEKGDLRQAEELMVELRDRPNNEALSSEINNKQIDFLRLIGARNIGQRRKVGEMFTTTRDLLGKYVTPRLIRELEAEVKAREQPVKQSGDEPGRWRPRRPDRYPDQVGNDRRRSHAANR